MIALIALACSAGLRGRGPHAEPKPNATLGSPLPELGLQDQDGRSRSLSEFEGQVVLLDFWATWCAPCLVSLPLYERWQQERGAQGLQVVAVSVDAPGAPVAEWADEHAPSVLVLRDPEGSAASTLDLPAMPTAFVLDRGGAVVGWHVGFAAGEEAGLDALLEPLLEPSP